jgi:hypothetical protein
VCRGVLLDGKGCVSMGGGMSSRTEGEGGGGGRTVTAPLSEREKQNKKKKHHPDVLALQSVSSSLMLIHEWPSSW